MSHQNGDNTTPAKDDGQPEEINLGDAAALTRGGEQEGVESKRSPYN